MSEPRVVYEATEGVATLTLDHPPVNGYSHELMRALDDAILRARFDEDVHVIVLTGAGEKFFCAGADIHGLAAMSESYKYQFCLHAKMWPRRPPEAHFEAFPPPGQNVPPEGLQKPILKHFCLQAKMLPQKVSRCPF